MRTTEAPVKDLLMEQRREVYAVFDAAKHNSQALEERERDDRRDGMVAHAVLAVLLGGLLLLVVASLWMSRG